MKVLSGLILIIVTVVNTLSMGVDEYSSRESTTSCKESALVWSAQSHDTISAGDLEQKDFSNSPSTLHECHLGHCSFVLLNFDSLSQPELSVSPFYISHTAFFGAFPQSIDRPPLA